MQVRTEDYAPPQDQHTFPAIFNSRLPDAVGWRRAGRHGRLASLGATDALTRRVAVGTRIGTGETLTSLAIANNQRAMLACNDDELGQCIPERRHEQELEFVDRLREQYVCVPAVWIAILCCNVELQQVRHKDRVWDHTRSALSLPLAGKTCWISGVEQQSSTSSAMITLFINTRRAREFRRYAW